MERFPFFSFDQMLGDEDFLRFSQSFSKIILERIPTATGVSFITTPGQFEAAFPDLQMRKTLLLRYEQAIAQRVAVKGAVDSLLLPFPLDTGKTAVAYVSGVDPLVIKRAGEDWLAEIHSAVLRDFLYLKQARIDTETGLLNSANLYGLLDALSDYHLVHLVLIEIPPRGRTPRDAFQNARKGAIALHEYAGSGLVHHIGQCVFAILLLQQDPDIVTVRFGSSLVASLKREGFHRVHIGSSAGQGKAESENEKKKFRDRLLTEAWAALQTANRRGHFSFCDYSVLAHPEKHPLNPHKDALIRKIRRRYQGSQSFSLIELKKKDQTGFPLFQLIEKYIEPDRIFAGDDTVVIFSENVVEEKARVWIGNILQMLERDAGMALQISAGIGCYPYADFKKSEILANCRKALLHAAFFGPSGVTPFDALSLNISGDIYYAEGDLPSAVKEYRRGLVCEPGNVNLLNSLGVAYALMDKHAFARESFKKALAVEPENFMSLYNLGLGEVLRGNASGGLQCFEKAAGAHSEEDGPEVKRDLQFQLAKLYCRLEIYDKALTLLLPWYGSCELPQSGGCALRYLGESCFGLGRKSEAMSWLQKALRFNEFDHEALSLLGLIYLQEGEGNEIALALCEKSVELNPSDTVVRWRLAKVQVECGLLTDARQNLVKCLGNKKIQAETQLCLGQIFQKLGRKKQTKYWFGKVLQQEHLAPEIIREVRTVIEN